MTSFRRPLVALSATALVAPLLLAGIGTPTVAAPAGPRRHPYPSSTESPQVVLDWQRTAVSTVYPAAPVPVGIPLLGYTSTAMNDAATWSMWRHDSSETAAVATAAHDVLAHYVPGAAPTLDARLGTTLAGVPDGEAEDRGVRIGEKVAARLIEDRADDGYGDTSIHYVLPPAIGTWQPVPPLTDMLGAWIGSMDPLVVRKLARVDGPDPLGSDDYTADYTEVKLLGSSTSTTRTQAQADTAVFFNINPAVMIGDALVRHLEAHPQSLEDTARMFAAIHGTMTDSVIRCWQLKRDVGFWRPIEAVAGAAADGNPDTAPQAGWASYLPTPPYSDYVSGHGCLTSGAIEVIRQTLGETTPLEARSANLPTAPRTYATLSDYEFDAFHSRIWGGLHFRDAMADGYAIGRRTARMVMQKLH